MFYLAVVDVDTGGQEVDAVDHPPDRQAPHGLAGKREAAHVHGLGRARRCALAPHAYRAVVSAGVEIPRLKPSCAPLHRPKAIGGGGVLEDIAATLLRRVGFTV